MRWHEQHGLRAKRRSSVSRFTISRSFSLLSLLPLSSQLDDPSRSLPTACLSVLRHGLLCSKLPAPHPTCRTSVFWIVFFFFIRTQFMAERNKLVNRRISITSTETNRRQICWLHFLLMGLFLAICSPEWVCVSKLTLSLETAWIS